MHPPSSISSFYPQNPANPFPSPIKSSYSHRKKPEYSKSHLHTLHQNSSSFDQAIHPTSNPLPSIIPPYSVGKKGQKKVLPLIFFSHLIGGRRHRNRRPPTANAAQFRLSRPNHRHHRTSHQHHPRLGPHRRAGRRPRARVRHTHRVGPAAGAVLRVGQGGGASGWI